MKFVLSDLKLGESLQGRITELFPGGEVLINFAGDLLRVQNETGKPLAIGDRVSLVVKAINPLRFQLRANRSEQRRKGHIDVNI